MTDWSKPTVTSVYDPDFLTYLLGRDVDVATMTAPLFTGSTPDGYIVLTSIAGGALGLRGNFKFQEWDVGLGSLQPLTLDLLGGGTGAVNAVNARANLGIGSMGVQNSGAVAITGGTISGITSLALSGSITFVADDSYDIGTNLVRLRKMYLRSGLVIPVGNNKYVTS